MDIGMQICGAVRFILAAAVVLLAGCGGGGGGGGGGVPMIPEPREPGDLTPAAEYARDFPQDYLKIPALNPDTAQLNAPAHQEEATWGIRNIGANVVHWSIDVRKSATEQTDEVRYYRGASVTVGVVDSGVQIARSPDDPNIIIGHPDLKDSIEIGDGVTVDDIGDIDPDGHGTRVALIIAGNLDGMRDVGVAPEAKILPRVLDYGDEEAMQEIYDYLSANHAFAVNASYGPDPQWVMINVEGGNFQGQDGVLADGEYWIRIPKQFAPGESGTLLTQFAAGNEYSIKATTEDNMLFVLAIGNGGWNSETGRVIYCPTNLIPLGRIGCAGLVRDKRTTLFLENSNIVSMTVRAIGRTLFPDGRSTIVAFEENSISSLSRRPVDIPDTAKHWLNVAAVGEDDVIFDFSNGCGVTKWRCLAAPGISMPALGANGERSSDDIETGTSYAAPYVTGAAALIKGAFPNLSPEDVANILLQSADERGVCESIGKKMSCADDVYGHGILNVAAAFTPLSFIQLAANDESVRGTEAFALEKSRIALSPAFAAAPWREESLRVGGLDNYGRVFYTQMDLSNGAFVVKPMVSEGDIDGGEIHRAYAPPLSQMQTGEVYSAGEQLASAEWHQPAAEGGLGYGVKHGSRVQSRHIGVSHGDGRLSWRYRSGGDWYSSAASQQGYWHAPFDNGEVHQFSWQHRLTFAGGIGAPQAGVLYSSGDGVHQMAGRLQWQRSNWRLQAEGGLLRENDQFLGASLEGAFAVEQSDTTYQRISGEYELDKLRLYADYVRSSSKAAGAGGIVKALHARADAWGAGVEYGRWNVSVSQPLAITRGRMGLSYISGYTAGGDYAVEERGLDLSSGSRMQRLSVQYVREAVNGLEFVLAADYLRNAPHRAYSGDAAVFSGALRYTF